MRRLTLTAMLLAMTSSACLAIDDTPWPDPGEDAATDGGMLDGDTPDGDRAVDAYWPYEHRPEDCPEEAERARAICDPSCDGVSHFYCTERPGDPCCACRRLGDGGNGGNGGGPGGGGGEQPPRPPPPPL